MEYILPLPVVLILFVVLCVLTVGLIAFFGFRKNGSNDGNGETSEGDAVTKEYRAEVKEKKTEINYGGIVYAPDDRLMYLINFVSDGKEMAFEVPKEDYERLNEGDAGTLCVTGNHYVGFAKEGEEEYAR